MDSIRSQLFLAALLHDIGKFYQRADKKYNDELNSLSCYSKQIAEDICPQNKNGGLSHKHVIWTNEFMERHRNIFESIPSIKQNLYADSGTKDSLVSYACNHHKPYTELQALISLADWWSAGIDRNDPNVMEQTDFKEWTGIKWGNDRYKKIPLYSIFNKINKPGYNGSSSSVFHLSPLNLESSSVFPKSLKSKEEGISEDLYKELWIQFEKEFKRLPTKSTDVFIESLIYLLKKYTWCIPSNTMDMADVSLFDHLKTTAAFADCLYVFKESNPDGLVWDKKRLTLKEGIQPVLLLGIDVSGIQNYIYSITSKNAAVSLKGRSFYIQLLIDCAIQRIISHPDIECSIGNVVYSSGGKSFILLPNTQKVCNAIAQISDDIENMLWDEHKGQISIIIDYVPFSFNTKDKYISTDKERKATVGYLWKVLSDKLNDKKTTRFSKLLLNNYDQIFTPQQVSTNIKVCSVTGIEIEDDTCYNNEDSYVSKTVFQQQELGKSLKNAKYLVFSSFDTKASHFEDFSSYHLPVLGIEVYVLDDMSLETMSSTISIDNARIFKINDTNFLDVPIKGNHTVYGYNFYGGNKQAKQYGNYKTFEELAEDSYLGVLRMDVDNLGKIFIQGLPDSDKSFAAYSTLSFILDLYFSGYINTIREKEQFCDSVNIIYAGGDDLFAVGRWDRLILFAEEVRESFSNYVGREDISISGGLTIVNRKFPIMKAAKLAGEAESEAKNYNDGEKNAINLFGHSLSWHNEFYKVKNDKERFCRLVKLYNMPKSILHRIVSLKKEKDCESLSYIWHGAYYLKRFVEKYSNNQEIEDLCNQLKIRINNPKELDLLTISARWAELELKEDNNNKQ